MKILVSGVGGDVAQSVLQILKSAHPNYEFHGCDQSDHHGGSIFYRSFFSLLRVRIQTFLTGRQI